MTRQPTDDRDDGPAAAPAAVVAERLRLDPLFPPELIDLQDAPDSVWIAGAIPPGPRVAIVGSRAADVFGCTFARRLGADLAEAGVPVVSGGAVGIDGAAHQGALDAGGSTVAVLGTGIDVAYPRGHAALFARIAGGGGALVTAYHPGAPPEPWRFAARNEILVALARVVVVVQAAHARSGALVSARAARALGRTLLAVPGPAGAVLSRGTSALLRAGQAGFCEGVADVLAALRAAPPPAPDVPDDGRETESAPPGAELASNPDAAKVWAALSDAAHSVEDVVLAAQIGPGVARSALMWLETRGLVRYEVGGRYARVRR